MLSTRPRRWFFGDVSTGAQSDLQRTTDIVGNMATEYGMSERIGLRTYPRKPRPGYLEGFGAPREREFSEQTAQGIDEEMARLLVEAHQSVRPRIVQRLGRRQAFQASQRTATLR
jgi:cell division protease FtsH